MARNLLRRWLSILDPLTRYIPIYDPLTRYIPIYDPLTRYVPIYDPLTRYIPIYDPLTRYVPIYDSLTRYVPIYDSLTRYVPIYDHLTKHNLQFNEWTYCVVYSFRVVQWINIHLLYSVPKQKCICLKVVGLRGFFLFSKNNVGAHFIKMCAQTVWYMFDHV